MITSEQIMRDALQRIAWLRPAGDAQAARNTRQLVEQMERIALEALDRAKDQPHDPPHP